MKDYRWRLVVRQNYTDIVFNFENQDDALTFIGVFVNSVEEPVTFSLEPYWKPLESN